jgi:hypothetical protein
MLAVAKSAAGNWRPLLRLVLTTTGQYALILVGGTVLWLFLSADDSGTPNPAKPTAGSGDMLTTMAFLTVQTLAFSWSVFFILLLTLGLLRGYGPRWRVWQRCAGRCC